MGLLNCFVHLNCLKIKQHNMFLSEMGLLNCFVHLNCLEIKQHNTFLSQMGLLNCFVLLNCLEFCSTQCQMRGSDQNRWLVTATCCVLLWTSKYKQHTAAYCTLTVCSA